MEGLMILLSTIALILIVIYDYQVKELYRKYRETNRDLRFENEEVLDTIQKILNLSTSNTYNNDKIVLSKIKELAETAIKN